MEERPIDVLLVEDNHADARLLIENLKEAAPGRFEATRVVSLEDAFRLLNERRFDAVLLDLSLPDSEGLDTVVRALEGAPHVAIVVLTGIDDEALGVEAVRRGAQDYFVKGQADWRLLVRALRYARERKLMADQLEALNESLEQRVAERTALAEQRATQLQALAVELTRTEERERHQLAQFLHDDLQQTLVAAKFCVANIRTMCKDANVKKATERVDELLDASIRSSRSLTQELSPPVLYDDGGFVSALASLATWMQEKHGLEVHVEADEKAGLGDANMRVLLFRAIRELLFNIVKHAKVNKAHVYVAPDTSDGIQVVVSDAGAGFDAAGIEARGVGLGGFGLFSIRERLQMLGGRIKIESQSGQGTRVTLSVPSQADPRTKTSKHSNVLV